MKSFSRVVSIMSRLRGPSGCPWDRKQTHASLLRYLFEEAREVRGAVRKKDYHNLEEELGDILLQVLFHAQIAKETGRFTIDDVVKTLARKLTLRHPHVFGFKREHRRLLRGKKLSSVDDVVTNWDLLKEASKRRPRASKSRDNGR